MTSPHRRTFLATAAAATLLPRAFAADTIEPALQPKPDVAKKLAALKPNQAVLLGNADVVGDFNDTARK
jgi:hypothetical protein